ncbi:MAG: DUF86 domain-containing protein [Pseudomonadota bacterium]|nr:DUF86 domain-containing protein [Gammaproteobacteria bacterium]MDQ3583800.1 DUF86 domain-containing protein [Pseudomonadota bacterium]
MNDIVVNKVQSIQRCAERASEEYRLAGNDFRTDYTRQDAAVLNVTRACEQAIDLANHLIRTYKMGIPVSSADSFALLAMKHVIPTSLEDKMRGMVGFRNIAVHEYRKLNVDIIEAVIRTGLDDLWAFTDYVVKYLKSAPPS